MRELEREGFEVTYLDVRPDGLVDLEAFKAALRPDTIVVSVMFVNNEIGVIQDIAAIGEICRARGIIFHVDAAQATGKIPIDLAALKVDLMSLLGAQDLRPEGRRRAVRAPQAARAHRGADARRRPRARHALGHAADAPDRRHGRGVPARAAGDGDRERAHPDAARPALAGPVADRGGLRQRRPRAARAAQPQRQLQLRRGREPDHGDQGHRGVVGLGLHVGVARAVVRAARARAAATSSRTARSASPSAASRPRRRSTTRSTLLKRKVAKLRELSPLWEMHKDGVDLNTVQWAAH